MKIFVSYIFIYLYVVVFALPVGAEQQAQPAKVGTEIRPLVIPGTQDQAEIYYGRIFGELGINGWESHTLDKLLGIGGYQGLSADDIETLNSTLLMPSNQAEFDALAKKVEDPDEFKRNFALADFTNDQVLVTRFFAPKITDVSVEQGHPEYQYGWRKLVRLETRAGLLKSKGIESIFLLFNFFLADLNEDPFAQRSEKNQAILVRGQKATELCDPIYWLVYDKPDGKLGYFLNGSFDARNPKLVDGKKYYVPDACAQCHGGLAEQRTCGGSQQRHSLFPKAKLNFLDTDHWFDRVQRGDDFDGVATSAHGVIFDGSKDQHSQQFKAAFEALRKLNTKIHKQNEAVDPDSFQVMAVKKWLEVHKGNDTHVPPIQRALGLSKDRKWGSDPDDKILLPLLNRYCFRCHSSLKYHVFDKEAVIRRKSRIERKMTNPNPPAMPQDRALGSATKKTILDLVKKLPDPR